jgi:hypothetical protein
VSANIVAQNPAGSFRPALSPVHAAAFDEVLVCEAELSARVASDFEHAARTTGSVKTAERRRSNKEPHSNFTSI